MKNSDIRQALTLEFIEAYTAEHRCPPTVREIMGASGARSTQTVFSDLRKLESKQLIEFMRGMAVPIYSDSYIEKLSQYIK